MSRHEKNDDATERPIYWFTILDLALEKGDFGLAANAQHELRRLGIEVRLHLDRKAVAHAR